MLQSRNRFILHADLNGFYASVECLYNPYLRDKPVIVTGDPNLRNGIVLTKNTIAKKYGIQTGEVIWQARQKCPRLVAVPADFPLYMRYSRSFRDILWDYSDRVEPFGLDEAWFDITAPGMDFDGAKAIADGIRLRVWQELGITASIGVSFNKVFAKLGSDMKKPNATTVITPDNFRAKVWPLPVGDLLYVGPATERRLKSRYITNIGQLANADPIMIKSQLGKNGLVVRAFARGEDMSPVMPYETETPVMSIGNSTTTPVDLVDESDVRGTVSLLAESVAARMREGGYRSRCISIYVRQAQGLIGHGCQKTIKTPTCVTRDLIEVAMRQYHAKEYEAYLPFRSVGISCSTLSSRFAPTQIDLFGEEECRLKQEALDDTVYWLKERYGQRAIELGVIQANPKMAVINPKEDDKYHQIAAPYYYDGTKEVLAYGYQQAKG